MRVKSWNLVGAALGWLVVSRLRAAGLGNRSGLFGSSPGESMRVDAGQERARLGPYSNIPYAKRGTR